MISKLKLFFIFTIFQLIILNSYAKSMSNDIQMLIMEQIPYGYITESGEKKGILYDILENVLISSNIENPVDIIPTKRLVFSMQDKHSKVCTIVANSPDMVLHDLIEPVGFHLTGGVLPASGIILDNYASLKNITIAVPLGIMFDEKFHNDDTLKKVRPLNYLNSVKMLKLGRVDAIAGAIPILKFLAKEQGLKLSSFEKPLVMIEADMYLTCTKSVKKSIQKRLKSRLIKLKKDGKIQKLIDIYLGEAK